MRNSPNDVCGPHHQPCTHRHTPFLPPLVDPQLACDGLWEQFTNQGAVDFVRASLQRGENAQDAANSLVAEALRRQV